MARDISLALEATTIETQGAAAGREAETDDRYPPKALHRAMISRTRLPRRRRHQSALSVTHMPFAQYWPGAQARPQLPQ
jgi:hypothetical protein